MFVNSCKWKIEIENCLMLCNKQKKAGHINHVCLVALRYSDQLFYQQGAYMVYHNFIYSQCCVVKTTLTGTKS